jgi:glutamate dehydrogenase
MQQRYGEFFGKHPLKREIIATVAINHVINHAGITFLPTLAAQTGADYGAIVQAYIEADNALAASRRRHQIATTKVDAEGERRQLLAIEHEVEQAVTTGLGRPVAAR